MLFSAAKSKLEDSYMIYEQLQKSDNAFLFKSLFNSFLSSSRAITYALQKEGSKINQFDKWYTIKQDEMKSDELLRFIHEARTEDFHEGKHRLLFSTYIDFISTDTIGKPPEENSSFVIGTQGPAWVTNPGTAKERIIPITNGGSFTIYTSIDNPPAFHRGNLLFSPSPINICKLTLEYMQELLSEANKEFSKD